jgi:hypothetical protein
MSHALPAHQVHVQVENDLSAVRAGVDDQAISGIHDPFLFGKLFSDREKPAHKGLILGQEVIYRCDVFDRDNQEVGGRDRMYVAKGDDFIVFVNDASRRFSLDDLAEDTIVHVASFGLGLPNYKCLLETTSFYCALRKYLKSNTRFSLLKLTWKIGNLCEQQ